MTDNPNSTKPSDILECLDQLSKWSDIKPPWYPQGLAAVHMFEIIMAQAAQEIRDLRVIRESYSRLYSQLYGKD